MRPFGRRIVALIGSPRFATALLALLGLWTIAATTGGNPGALSAPPFLAAVLALAVSTAVCAWRRTGVALRRTRALQAAAAGRGLPSGPRFEIVCDPTLGGDEIFGRSRAALRGLRIAADPVGERLVATTPAWSVWGSPIFHWALVALIVLVPLGNLARSSGQMGIAVGQSKPDQPSSYGRLTAGPLRDWWGVRRSVRVDDFEANYSFHGVDRGPTPTVSVLDESGSVIASQRVYPNHTLKTGSLAVYPADYGLAADVSVLAPDGAELRRSAELLDFSGKAEGGTVPVTPLVVESADGSERFDVAVSVPLDRTGRGFLGRLPADVRARVLVTSADGQTVLDEGLRPGEALELPSGGMLRLNGVDYYARLQLVDDPSVPLLYLAGALAILGLGVATFARQMIVVAQVVETADGRRLEVRADLWRDLATSRDEIAAELERVLGGRETGGRP